MDFKDKFSDTDKAKFINLPKPLEKLNGKEVLIIDREFKGWSGWHYKLSSYNGWFQQGCLTHI